MNKELIHPFVSVIVPVFNAGKYLEQCILSILHQNLKKIEVIAVNDGSTDNSAEILDTIAKQDSRLCVYHCANKGVSSAPQAPAPGPASRPAIRCEARWLRTPAPGFRSAAAADR